MIILEKLLGYTTLRGFAAQLSEFEKTSNFQPALIEIEETLRLYAGNSEWPDREHQIGRDG
jgi:hypothetical protein